MKKCARFFFLLVGFFLYEELFAKSPIEDLTKRIAGKQASAFIYQPISADGGKDVFELESAGSKISIKGNNCNSMATGLSYYLKYYCKTNVSWYADESIQLPEVLPSVPQKIRKTARVEKRFFLNYCTFGYTMPWWQWRDWERLIDWMALNGINMPLAITGQEAVWYNVWKKFGLNDLEIRSYFTGPAHLPWHRMSNLDKWQGPLPVSWIKNQEALQKKILARERELGMKPVLLAFAGHVPQVLKNKFPAAKISKLSEWGGFEDKYRSWFLDPSDSLFNKIQKAFLKEQTRIFGTDHIYGADPFNEVKPPNWEPEYLAGVSKNIQEGIHEIDPEAVWLMMTWIFYFEKEDWTRPRIESFLKGIPQNKIMLMDYYCENTEVWRMTNSYFNQPFIWCYLGNFGGNTMLAGNIDEVEKRMEKAYTKNPENLCGIGSTPEGFDVNSMMYEYVFEKAWSNGATDTKNWIKNWADRRTGAEDTNAKAWNLLHQKIYNQPVHLGQATLTNARPALSGSGNWTTNNEIKYDNNDLLNAWELLLKCKAGNRPAFQYDVVNIGRQVLGNYFTQLRDRFTAHYQKKELTMMKKTADAMMELLDNMDRLLATQSSFLLGKWLNDAKRFGINSVEKKYYEQNARTLITTWGTKAQSLNDYGNRTWSGLLKGYYKVRWKMFTEAVIKAVENGKIFDEKAFAEKVTAFEWNWTMQGEVYSHKPAGNAVEIAKELCTKYALEIRAK